jgi:Flp pilus assembly protein TadG
MKRSRTLFHRDTSNTGQAAVEIAFIVVAFFLLMFTIIVMSLVIFTYSTISSATREAVRYAALHGPVLNRPPPVSCSDVKTFVLNHTTNLVSSNLTINLTWPADQTLPSQQDALVKTSYNYKVQIPFMPNVTLVLTSTSQMLVEQ